MLGGGENFTAWMEFLRGVPSNSGIWKMKPMRKKNSVEE